MFTQPVFAPAHARRRETRLPLALRFRLVAVLNHRLDTRAAPLPGAWRERAASALLQYCSGIAPGLLRCWSLGYPMGIRWVSDGYLMGILGSCGDAEALWPVGRSLPARDYHVEPHDHVPPRIHLAPHGNNDSRTGPRCTKPPIVHRGYVASVFCQRPGHRRTGRPVSAQAGRGADSRVRPELPPGRRFWM